MKRQKKSKPIYVAVVVRDEMELGEGLVLSMRPKGDWASFVGRDREMVVEAAHKAAQEWGVVYSVVLGQITGVVAFPIRFEVIPL